MSTLVPGVLSPVLPVPETIERPEYVGQAAARPATPGPRSRTPTRSSGCGSPGGSPRRRWPRSGDIAPGVTTDELDRVGHEFLCDHGAYPSTLGYSGFPKSLCTSVNEVICHGIPDSTVLRDGDIVNIDITAYIGGVHGDTDATYLSARSTRSHGCSSSEPMRRMSGRSRRSHPGGQVSVIGRVIESYARRFGYGVVRDFTGHGIGTSFHSGLIIPHYDDPPTTRSSQPGMTFTIEPMLTLGTARLGHVGRRLDRRDQGPASAPRSSSTRSW